MKKLVYILLMGMTLICTSCVTTMSAQNPYAYNDDENVVVVGDTCYVYYQNPTTTFLSTLSVIDGAYFWLSNGRYLPVVFPYWSVWSPYRYFYYETNRWLWRDRFTYNHYSYRQHHTWRDYRHHRPINYYNRGSFDQRHPIRPHYNNNNFQHRPFQQHQQNGTQHRPNFNKPSSTQHTTHINRPSFQPSHNGGSHMNHSRSGGFNGGNHGRR